MYVSIRRKDKDMENFSRMTMLIPFSEYQKKIEAKAGSGDSQILKGGVPRCVIGETYPDLYSQAMYIERDMEKVRGEITGLIKGLFDDMGDEAVSIAIDSIYDFTARHLGIGDNISDLSENCDLTWEGLRNLENGIYCRGELAKTMLSLYLKNSRLRNLRHDMKLTEQNVLL